jgi:cation diffusion facilitator CzcD-associated flavoprotein CzcO
MVQEQATRDTVTRVDVLIVGAGISGIGSAYHLQQQCPEKSYAILEMKESFGGTWETNRYPGVRSDSDLYTFGYRFKPWVGAPIASGEEILWVFGYFRASWTLRVDMLGDFVCKLLNHMDRIGAKRVEVALRDEDRDMQILPWIEEDNFNPGYLMRGLDQLPQRGDKPEWRHNQDYWTEREEIPAIDLDGEEFVYDGVHRSAAAPQRGSGTR